MPLNDTKLQQVERVLLCLEGVMDNDSVRAELDALERGHEDQMTLVEAIGWLYQHYRSRCIGQRYDKLKWAADILGIEQESMKVAQERTLETLEDRMEMAFIRNDREEIDDLERLHRRTGSL